jgi:hypothetical protein
MFLAIRAARPRNAKEYSYGAGAALKFPVTPGRCWIQNLYFIPVDQESVEPPANGCSYAPASACFHATVSACFHQTTDFRDVVWRTHSLACRLDTRVEARGQRQNAWCRATTATAANPDARKVLPRRHENGIDAEKRKQQQFFALAERFPNEQDPEAPTAWAMNLAEWSSAADAATRALGQHARGGAATSDRADA